MFNKKNKYEVPLAFNKSVLFNYVELWCQSQSCKKLPTSSLWLNGLVLSTIHQIWIMLKYLLEQLQRKTAQWGGTRVNGRDKEVLQPRAVLHSTSDTTGWLSLPEFGDSYQRLKVQKRNWTLIKLVNIFINKYNKETTLYYI